MSEKNIFIAQGLKHGGRILEAASKYNIPEKDWLDLSTGLNPNGWPVPEVPAQVWQSLPEDIDGLQHAACQFYHCDFCLPVSGSQAAIQILPTIRPFSRVGVISPTYAEHEFNWKQAGHDVIQLIEDEVDAHLHELDVLVVINPNNPSGNIIASEKLLSWYHRLSAKGGWLVVDEAFMDAYGEQSLLTQGIKPGLILLRSMGKFFGLAGIRCGFVMSDKELLQQLAKKLGPWSLSGATRYIAKRALEDKSWHKKTIQRLNHSSKRLHDLLCKYGLTPIGGTVLFQWLPHPNAKDIYIFFAKQGILIRYFKESRTEDTSLRFGLPKTDEQWRSLENSLIMLYKTTEIVNNKKNMSYV